MEDKIKKTLSGIKSNKKMSYSKSKDLDDIKSSSTVASARSKRAKSFSARKSSVFIRPKKSRNKKKKKARSRDNTETSATEDEEISDLPQDYYKDEKKNDYMRNRMSVPWFQTINMTAEQQKEICFSESLLMVDEIGRIAGKMYTTISQSKWGDQHCLCVHSGSFGTLSDGLECGTTITGFVSPDMKTLKEYVYEWASSEGKVTERKTFVMREENSVHVRILLVKDGETKEKKSFTLGRLEQQNLVTESSNIILLRLVMLDKRTMGGMDLNTLTFTGKVVKTKYAELGNGWENVKGEQIRTWSIRRTVEFDFGDRLWDSMFNQHGRLVLRCQPENTHALIPLWYEPVKQFKNGKFVGCYPPYVWACDAELHAKYLLKKVKL